MVDFYEALAKFYYLLLTSRMAEQEAPFVPREKILERQKYFQSIQKHTYLKGPLDKVTSVAIPIALAATSLFLIVSRFFYFLNSYLFSFLFWENFFASCPQFSLLVLCHFSLFSFQGKGIYNMSHGIGKKEWWGNIAYWQLVGLAMTW